MNTSKVLSLALLIALWASSTRAENPETIRQNYPMITFSQCVDNVSSDRGLCYLFDRMTGDGNMYVVFVQYGKPVWVRETLPDGSYLVVWEATMGVSL